MNIQALDALINGDELIGYKESGNSMTPLIKHREPVDVWPVNPDLIEKGDIVVAKVHGRIYTHLVWAVQGNRVQIGNNHGRSNGWTTKNNVYGIVTHVNGVERRGATGKVRD